MEKIEIFKTAFSYVATAGAHEIVTNIVKSTLPDATSKIKSLSISAATIALTSMLSDAMTKHIDSKVDEIYDKITHFGEEEPK